MKKSILFFFIVLLGMTHLLLSEPPDWEPISGTQYSMVVFTNISLYYNPFTGSDTCNITAAFGPGGESDCRSLGAWQPDYPPYWDGYWYFDIVSNNNNESISFKIYDSISDSVYPCLQMVLFEDGSTIGNPYTPFELTTHPVSVDLQPVDPLHVSAYPNPFRDEIVFSFSQPLAAAVSVVLYDITGSYITESASDYIANNRITLSLKDKHGIEIKPGIYLYSLTSEDIVYTGKILHIKD